MVNQKITLEQIKKITELEGEIGVNIEELSSELKIIVNASKKLSKIIKTDLEIEELTNLEGKMEKHLQTLTEELKIAISTHEKMSDIFEKARKTVGYEIQ